MFFCENNATMIITLAPYSLLYCWEVMIFALITREQVGTTISKNNKKNMKVPAKTPPELVEERLLKAADMLTNPKKQNNNIGAKRYFKK